MATSSAMSSGREVKRGDRMAPTNELPKLYWPPRNSRELTKSKADMKTTKMLSSNNRMSSNMELTLKSISTLNIFFHSCSS
jgi:hypothetical protein